MNLKTIFFELAIQQNNIENCCKEKYKNVKKMARGR